MTTTIRQPKVTVNIVNANVAVENTAQKILFVGQKIDAGSAVAGALDEFIPNDRSEENLYGRNSMLATLIRANKRRNKQVQVDAISLDDAESSTAAAGTITVDGTASESGSFIVIVGSERSHTSFINIASGESASDIGEDIADAINIDLDVPVIAVNDAGTVTLTAINKGTYGNTIPIEVRGSVAGMTTTVTGMGAATLGAGDPTLTNVFDVIGERRYQAIVWPYPNDVLSVLALLDPRFNADGKVLDGVAFTAKADSLSNLTALVSPFNSQSLVIFGDQFESESNYAGPSVVEIPMVIAAYWAGFPLQILP